MQSFKLTLKEMVKAKIRASKARSIKLLLVITVALVAIKVMRNGWTNELTLQVIIYASILLFIGLPLYLFINMLSCWWLLKNNQIFQKPMEGIVTCDSIELKGSTNTASYKWDDVYKVIEMKDLFMVYVGRHMYHIFPKRALEDNEIAVLMAKA